MKGERERRTEEREKEGIPPPKKHSPHTLSRKQELQPRGELCKRLFQKRTLEIWPKNLTRPHLCTRCWGRASRRRLPHARARLQMASLAIEELDVGCGRGERERERERAENTIV